MNLTWWISHSEIQLLLFNIFFSFAIIFLNLLSLLEFFRINRLDDDFSIITIWFIMWIRWIIRILCSLKPLWRTWTWDLYRSRSSDWQERRCFWIWEVIKFIICGSISCSCEIFLWRVLFVGTPKFWKSSFN